MRAIVESRPVTLNRRLFNFLRRVVASLYCGLLLLQIVLYYRALHPYDPSWVTVHGAGVLRVGMDPTYPPFGSFGAGGAVSGLDVDLAEEIARRLKVTAQIVPLGIDGLYSALQTGQVDVLISALPVDSFRWQIYSLPYFDAGYFLTSRTTYTRIDHLEGKTVAVEYGSLGDEIARRWVRRLHILRIKRFVSPDEALKAATNGEADAALVDHVSARLYLRAQGQNILFIAEKPVSSEPYAIGIRGRELEARVNGVLVDMIEDGTLDKILARWL